MAKLLVRILLQAVTTDIEEALKELSNKLDSIKKDWWGLRKSKEEKKDKKKKKE